MFVLNIAALNSFDLSLGVDSSSVSHVLRYLVDLSWCSNIRHDQIVLDFSKPRYITECFWGKLTEELFSHGWKYHDVIRLLCQAIYPKDLDKDSVIKNLGWTAIDAVASYPINDSDAKHCRREDGLETAQRIIALTNKGVPLDRIILHYHWENGRKTFQVSFVEPMAWTLIKNINTNRNVFLRFFRHNPKLRMYDHNLDAFAMELFSRGHELPLWNSNLVFKETYEGDAE